MSDDIAIPSYDLTQEQIDQYRRDGFIQLDNVITGSALNALRTAVEAAVAEESKDAKPSTEETARTTYEKIFNQKVDLWRRHPDVARFALSKSLGSIARRLEGVPMRMWHDQALFKEPNSGNNKTPWHQDAVYWPHVDRWRQTTIWIALKDATTENGCMAFVPGSQSLGPQPPINLGAPTDLFESAPHVRKAKPEIRPLKAGSVTFHNGLCFHYAGPNKSSDTREAFAIIYMPEDTRYSGEPHIVTDAMGLEANTVFDPEKFPLVS